MKNYEKYADEIRQYKGSSFCEDFIKRYILKSDRCISTNCTKCKMLQIIWLLEDYEEPETDWNKIEVDTPILVRADEEEAWDRRYFAKYENGHVYAWVGGCTSWTEENASAWKYAKLAENEEGGAE